MRLIQRVAVVLTLAVVMSPALLAAAQPENTAHHRPGGEVNIQLPDLNQGDFLGAMAARAKAEAISKVLYPSDATPTGQELRLRQEYFFTSASLQDIVGRHLRQFDNLDALPEHEARAGHFNHFGAHR